MNSEEHKQAAEQWLDEAIERFRQTGPGAGFENRIIAELRARAVRRRRQWVFALTGAAAAVVVAALAASLPRAGRQAPPSVTQQSTLSQNDIISPTPLAPLTAANQPQQSSQRRASRPILSTKNVMAGAPKQEVFPTPTALNEQGKLLQAYLRQTPEQELTLIASRQRAAADADIQELSIAPIQIKELNPIEEKDQE